ncbi:hypothetical protein LA080_003003 [Diaporthe eres]|nr:hypothetical protein LA080_003003 [Diaporthe eres]
MATSLYASCQNDTGTRSVAADSAHYPRIPFDFIPEGLKNQLSGQLATEHFKFGLVSIALKLFASCLAMEEYSTSSVLSTYGGGGLTEFEFFIVASATCTSVSYGERV